MRVNLANYMPAATTEVFALTSSTIISNAKVNNASLTCTYTIFSGSNL